MFPEELVIAPDKQEDIFEMRNEYPYIIRQICPHRGRTTIAPWHWHEELELVYVKKGILLYLTPQDHILVSEGDGLFINSNVLHQVLSPAPAQEITYEVHMFRRCFLAEEHSLSDKKYVRPFLQCAGASSILLRQNVTEHKSILNDLLSLSSLNDYRPFGFELLIRNTLTRLWLALLQMQEISSGFTQAADSGKEARLKNMVLYIQEHYMDSLTLKQLSAAANISPRECLRCFQDVLHTTPFSFLQDYRMQSACRMLENPSLRIADIAYLCGFSSSSYFGKVFRRHIKCTPYEYRQSLLR